MWLCWGRLSNAEHMPLTQVEQKHLPLVSAKAGTRSGAKKARACTPKAHKTSAALAATLEQRRRRSLRVELKARACAAQRSAANSEMKPRPQLQEEQSLTDGKKRRGRKKKTPELKSSSFADKKRTPVRRNLPSRSCRGDVKAIANDSNASAARPPAHRRPRRAHLPVLVPIHCLLLVQQHQQGTTVHLILITRLYCRRGTSAKRMLSGGRQVIRLASRLGWRPTGSRRCRRLRRRSRVLNAAKYGVLPRGTFWCSWWRRTRGYLAATRKVSLFYFSLLIVFLFSFALNSHNRN